MSTQEEEKESHNEIKEKGDIVLLKKYYRFIAYMVIVSIEMAINVSSGVLSSASKTIKSQYNMTDLEFGYLGLAQGIGRTIGCIFYTIMVNQTSPKWLAGAFSIVKGGVLAAFELTNLKWMLIFLRCVIGFFHMPPSTYIPIWIDQYGFRKYKTVQMSFLQALVPIGKVLGFVLVDIFGEENWKITYVIEGGFLLICGFFILFSPSNYFNKNIVIMKDEEIPPEYNKNEYKGYTFFYKKISKKGQSKVKKLWNDLITVICCLEFEICNCVKALQNGSQSCIHFWCGDFMVNRLGIDGSKKTFIYMCMNISGPLLGFIISPIINKYFGSYETKHTPYVICVLHFITITFGLCATLINNIITFIIFMTLFFGLLSLSLAMTNGCLMISVSSELKGISYSVGNITCMSIAGSLFPIIYGEINDIFNPKGIKYAGMLSIMIINGIAVFFLFYLGRIRSKRFNIIEKIIELNDKDNIELELN